MDKIKNNHQAVVMLQLAKNYFEEVAIEANQPPSIISMNAQLIDEVQKYLEPNLDCNKLQKELEKSNVKALMNNIRAFYLLLISRIMSRCYPMAGV